MPSNGQSGGSGETVPRTTPSVGQRLSGSHYTGCSVMEKNTCVSCEMEPDKDGVVLGNPPSIDGPMCNVCVSTMYEEETLLSGRESEVAALKEFGYSHSEIAELLQAFSGEGGPTKSTVDEYSRRLKEKRDMAEKTMGYLSWLGNEVRNERQCPEGGGLLVAGSKPNRWVCMDCGRVYDGNLEEENGLVEVNIDTRGPADDV